MNMKEPVVPITTQTLVGDAAKAKAEGCRFVTLSCLEVDENNLEILYHFDRNLHLKHLRLRAPKGSSVPSISPVYFAAALVENEIQDLFGIRFEGLVIDYHGTFYLEEEAKKTPFCRLSIQSRESRTDVAEPVLEGEGGSC
jgi:ech hydrogenase subunit D